jgi:hypothetical protein
MRSHISNVSLVHGLTKITRRRKIMSLSNVFVHKTLRWIAVFAVVLSLLAANFGAALASNSEPGAVYIQTNQVTGLGHPERGRALVAGGQCRQQ